MSDWDRVQDVLAGKRTGETVRLRGWVHRQRTAGKMAFVVLRDGTGTVQCTVKAGVADDDSLAAAKDAVIESSVSLLEGEAVADDRAPGGFEVKVTKFVLHQRADDFPLRGEQGTEFELDNRHLWLRSTELSAVFRVKHRLLSAARAFFDAEGFVETDPSVITTNACEGGSTLFTFDYFGKTAYLSQSAQMYLEGLIFGTPKVYSVTNSFRAEKSRTAKHLTEFHHLEAEYAWWDHEASLRFQERLVERLAHDVAEHCAGDLRVLGQDPERLAAVKAPFVRITYHDAAKRLRDLGFQFPDGEDFGAPHEQALGEEDDLTQDCTSPFFVTHWPAEIKAFYMKRNADDPSLVDCADLIGPGGFGELIGGSERSEDVEWMEQRLLEQLDHEMAEASDWNKATTSPAFSRDNPPLESLPPEHACNTLRTAIRQIPIPSTEEFQKLAGPEYSDVSMVLLEAWRDDEEFYRAKVKEENHYRGPQLDDIMELVRVVALLPYKWYFDLRRYGSVPHSGFGLGIERVLRWFTGQEHIRDMLPYPRTPSRAYP